MYQSAPPHSHISRARRAYMRTPHPVRDARASPADGSPEPARLDDLDHQCAGQHALAPAGRLSVSRPLELVFKLWKSQMHRWRSRRTNPRRTVCKINWPAGLSVSDDAGLRSGRESQSVQNLQPFHDAQWTRGEHGVGSGASSAAHRAISCRGGEGGSPREARHTPVNVSTPPCGAR